MRTGEWIVTFTGRQFFVTDAHPNDVCIEDIAHALSLLCRYGGHCRQFYSVAQHSCYVADLVASWHPNAPRLQLAALLHDATEAYLGDMVRPLKRALPGYQLAEQKLEHRILLAFDLCPGPDASTIIKRADNMVLMAERRDIVNHCDLEWSIAEEPCKTPVLPVCPAAAERLFLARYARLVDGRALAA